MGKARSDKRSSLDELVLAGDVQAVWGDGGFRDLEVFNLALLAKQGWRLIQNLDSLVAQILKAKYFPSGSFLQARLGSHPSYAWRCMIKALPILEQGLIWRMGSRCVFGETRC